MHQTKVTERQYTAKSEIRPARILLAALFVATFLELTMPARASNLVDNGNFAMTSLSTAGAVLSFGGTLTDWGVCTPVTSPAPQICPSGASSPNNGADGLAFLYFPGTQTDSLTDTYGTNNFALYQGASPNTIPNSSPAGGNFLVADGGGNNNLALYQTLTGLTAGANYVLTFDYAAGQQNGLGGNTTEQWEVYFGTTTTYSTQYTPLLSNPQGDFQPWTEATMDFKATSTTQILEFLALGSPIGDPPMDFLANVNLSPAPEPSSLVIGGIGLFALLVGRGLGIKRLRKRSEREQPN